MKRSTLIATGIVLVAVLLVALRDFLFVNLNYHLDFLEHKRAFSYAHSRFQAAMSGAGAADLRILKWVLALLFTVLNLVLAILLARTRTGDHRYRRFLILAFAAVAALALASHFASAVLPVFRPLSIMLLHALQYPVVLLLLWLATVRRGA